MTADIIMEILSAAIKGVVIIMLIQKNQYELGMALATTYVNTAANVRNKIAASN